MASAAFAAARGARAAAGRAGCAAAVRCAARPAPASAPALARPWAPALPRAHPAPRGFSGASGASGVASPSVEALAGPQYTEVPVLQEDLAKVWDELPDLALSGPQERRAVSSATRLTLDQAIPLEDAESGAAADADLPGGGLAMPETRFGKLANGVRVASVDRQGMCASVGLFVHAGSRYESAEKAYLPHALELMAFRSSAHLSHLRTLKTMEQLGAAASCRVGREDILYQFDALREYVPVMLPLMLANVLCPALTEEELEAARAQALETRQLFEENTEGFLSEVLHIAAYRDNTLGNALYAEEEDLVKFTAENLREYIRRECRPDRLILVGVNCDFDELCKWTARSFAETGAANGVLAADEAPRETLPAKYTGGDQRLPRENPLCHLMLGWEVEGGWNGSMLAAVTVLQMFLGGGGSFSTGGPGKGMHTRLYTEVLNRHHWVESCQASSVMYADSGLFTIYATVVPQHAKDFIDVIARIFKSLSRISPEELQRAKNQLKSSIHMNLEMRAVMMEDIGRQLVLSNKVGTAQEFGDIVDAVTVEDLLACLRSCLKTEPTVVAYGAIDRVPKYEQVKQAIQNNIP